MPRPLSHPTLTAIDDQIYRSVRCALYHHEDAERAILAITRAQNLWPIAGLLVVIVDGDRRAAWARATAVLGSAFAVAKLVSRTVGRPRPKLDECPPARHKPDRQSFPSTHTTVSFAAAIALPPLLPRTPLIALAVATASGRLLLGEHYPTDITAGAALGAAMAAPFARAAI